MRVHFHATLRDAVGGRDPDVRVPPGTTVRGLLDEVVARWPAARALLLDPDGRLAGHVHVFVNGRDARYLAAGMDTPLGAADEVDLFPAVGGG